MATESLIPESVLQSAKTTLNNIEQLETHLTEFLSLCDTDVLAEMSPLERARSLLLLAKANTTLFALRLRCKGVHPEDHRIKSELERLSLYEDKFERMQDLSKAPIRPSATLNAQAATRFIEHSLPDLTPEQRQSMRDISRTVGPKNSYTERTLSKKRKYESSDRQSVQEAAKDFLEKATRELLGDNKGSFKGPIVISSEEEDESAS